MNNKYRFKHSYIHMNLNKEQTTNREFKVRCNNWNGKTSESSPTLSSYWQCIMHSSQITPVCRQIPSPQLNFNPTQLFNSTNPQRGHSISSWFLVLSRIQLTLAITFKEWRWWPLKNRTPQKDLFRLTTKWPLLKAKMEWQKPKESGKEDLCGIDSLRFRVLGIGITENT